jgi:hypothetical protein
VRRKTLLLVLALLGLTGGFLFGFAEQEAAAVDRPTSAYIFCGDPCQTEGERTGCRRPYLGGTVRDICTCHNGVWTC